MKHKFHKILIANRGEIAVRIIKTAQKLGIETVAIYAQDDADALHVQMADEAYLLKGTELSETYLNQSAIIQIALDTEADAIHPGYGFLAENAVFAEKVETNGILFIGATPEQIRLMGEKNKANTYVQSIGIPILPSIRGSVDHLLSEAQQLKFPILVKASAGGGGKGMIVVQHPNDLPNSLEQAARQAQQYFGNGELFAEQFLQNARHIEVQLMGDGQGNVVHLFERDCSMQRRYQKVVEEAPASFLKPETKAQLYELAISIAKAVNYRGAGTIEFLVDEDENCWFLEMNTRLQVEHPVTEMITGIDLVEWQFEIASGNGIPLVQKEIELSGHAIEARICAEDPENNFMPVSGEIKASKFPKTARWDGFVQEGLVFSPSYDSLMGKLIVLGTNRNKAIDKLANSFDELLLGGITTNQRLLKSIVLAPEFRNGKFHTNYIGERLNHLIEQSSNEKNAINKLTLSIAYLLHHFYSGKESSFWRINPTFDLKVEKDWLKLFFQKQSEHFIVIYNTKKSIVSDVAFTANEISFLLDGKSQKALVYDSEISTVVQVKSQSFEIRSNYLLNQVTLNKKSTLETGNVNSTIISELFGKIVDVLVKPGEQVEKGQAVLVMESMKTEITIQSTKNAIVKNVLVQKGNSVKDKDILVELE